MIIQDIQKTYNTTCVLDIPQLSLDKGKVHGLLGANGAGKSTLIKILTGLVYADQPQPLALGTLTMLPENPYVPIHLTALQWVSHACRIQKAGASPEELLQEVALKQDAWHKPVHTYSKGMKQRTAIAYALAGQPEWLVLDEPMSGLDAMGRQHLLRVFEKRNKQGISIVMCSHAVTDLVRLCDQIHIMANGRVCESVSIVEHTMAEVESVEERLVFWSKDYAVD